MGTPQLAAQMGSINPATATGEGQSRGYLEHTMIGWERAAEDGGAIVGQFQRDGGALLALEEELWPLRGGVRELSLDAVREFRFSDVGVVCVSPSADVKTVVNNMIFGGELWVNARDVVSTGGTGVVTVWSLVAGQLRRFATSQSGLYRQAYLEMILRAAARLQGLARLLELLDSHVPIRIERFEAGAAVCRFDAFLPADANGPDSRNTALRVEVGKSGPRVTDLLRARSGDKRNSTLV